MNNLDEDALTSETKVINVYLHLKPYRHAEPNGTQSWTTGWTATSSGHSAIARQMFTLN